MPRKDRNTSTDELDALVEDEPTVGEETEASTDEPEPAKKESKKKDPEPEGWTTPTGLAHMLTERYDEYSKENPFKPQMVYGYVKNGKEFPHKQHTDGRVIVEIEPALAWVDERIQKRREREAAKAAEPAAEEAAAE